MPIKIKNQNTTEGKHPLYNNKDFILKKIKHRIKYMTYLMDTINLYGADKCMRELNELRLNQKLEFEPLMDEDEITSYLKKEDKIICDTVLNKCLIEFCKKGVRRQDIFNIDKRGYVTMCRDICITLLGQYTLMTANSISVYFNRSRQIGHASKVKHNLRIKYPKKFKDNEEYLYFYNKINEVVKKNKKIITLKTKLNKPKK